MSLWLVFLRFACDFLTDFRLWLKFFVFVDNGAQKNLSSGSLIVDKNRNASFIYVEEDLQYEDLLKMVSKDFTFKEEEISLSYRISLDLKSIIKIFPQSP